MNYRKPTIGLCCKNCTKRYPGCHDHCEEYQNAKKTELDKRKQIKEKSSLDNQWISYKAQYFDRGTET